MRRLLLATALVLASLPAAAARASVYTDVLHVYQRDGSIPPCQFSSSQLSTALKGIDTYGQQYFADFTNAVQNALAARASGACNSAASRAALSAHAPSAVAAPALPPSATSSTDADLPAPIILMASLAAVVMTVLAVRAIALTGGWQPEWATRWRHAWGEAGYRAGGAWADFVDWFRSRR